MVFRHGYAREKPIVSPRPLLMLLPFTDTAQTQGRDVDAWGQGQVEVAKKASDYHGNDKGDCSKRCAFVGRGASGLQPLAYAFSVHDHAPDRGVVDGPCHTYIAAPNSLGADDYG
jgi:hypothetical protein